MTTRCFLVMAAAQDTVFTNLWRRQAGRPPQVCRLGRRPGLSFWGPDPKTRGACEPALSLDARPALRADDSGCLSFGRNRALCVLPMRRNDDPRARTSAAGCASATH